MKIGVRKPSLKKSFKARTTAKAKRRIKKAINPLYGKKGMGLLNNPKKAIYNKVYNKTTVSLFKHAKKKRRKKSYSSKKTYKTTSKSQNQEQLSFDDAGSVFSVLLGTLVDIVISFNVLINAGFGKALATFVLLFLLIMTISAQIEEKSLCFLITSF